MTDTTLTLLTLLFTGTLALCLGIMASVLLRIGGLVLIVFAMASLFALRWWGGFLHPNLIESILMLVLLQSGYLIGALTPLADRIRRGEPAPRLTAKPDENPE